MANDNHYTSKIQSIWRTYTIRSQMWYMNRFHGTHAVGSCLFKNKKFIGNSNNYNTLAHTTIDLN